MYTARNTYVIEDSKLAYPCIDNIEACAVNNSTEADK